MYDTWFVYVSYVCAITSHRMPAIMCVYVRVCLCCVQVFHSILLCEQIKSRINQSIGSENFLNSLARMFIANLSHQILLKIVCWFFDSLSISVSLFSQSHHFVFFLFYHANTESRTKCIPKSNDNMYVASTSWTSECTSLVIVWRNNCQCSSNTTSSNKRFTNSATATIANCNASFEFQNGKTLYTGRLSWWRSHRRNTTNGKAWKHGMTIGNAQSRRYGSVNTFSFHFIEIFFLFKLNWRKKKENKTKYNSPAYKYIKTKSNDN